MELILLSLLLSIFIFLLQSIFPHKLFSKQKHSTTGENLPPGKTGWPIIGETLEFLSMGRKGTPEKFIDDRMTKYSFDIFKTSLLGEKMVVLCGPTGNKFLFSNENKLVSGWWPRPIQKILPFAVTGGESMKMRKLFLEFFKAEPLQKHVGIMDFIAKNHLESYWDFKRQVMVFPLAKRYALAVACKLFLGIEDPERLARFSESFDTLTAGLISIPINLPCTPFNQGIKAANKVRKDLLQIIRERKSLEDPSQKSDILLDMLTTREEDGKTVNEMDIADNILGLLIGGHDTISCVITFIIKYLAELPDVYDKVLKEQIQVEKEKEEWEALNWKDIQKMKYSWNVASEVMRLTPPGAGTFRKTLTDFTYAGFNVPTGWKILCSIKSTHKNPMYFNDPEKFDPSRFEGSGPIPYTYIPFGGGPRMCPGKEYARLEILVFMYNLVRKFKWEKILENENIIVAPVPRPAKGLPIRIYPR